MDNKKTFKTWNELSFKEKLVRLFLRRILILDFPIALIITTILSFVGAHFSFSNIVPSTFISSFIQYFILFTVIEFVFAFKNPSKKRTFIKADKSNTKKKN